MLPTGEDWPAQRKKRKRSRKQGANRPVAELFHLLQRTPTEKARARARTLACSHTRTHTRTQRVEARHEAVWGWLLLPGHTTGVGAGMGMRGTDGKPVILPSTWQARDIIQKSISGSPPMRRCSLQVAPPSSWALKRGKFFADWSSRWCPC